MSWDEKRNILEKRLKKYPPVCPKCNKDMYFGYLGGDYTRWRKIGEIRKNNSDYLWLSSIPYSIPSYICNDCSLVIGQYKLKSKNKKYDNQSNKIFEYCPNCNYKLQMGYTFTPQLTWWSKYKFGLGKTLAITTKFPHKKLPTKKCSNCGLFFLRYKTKR